MTRRDFFSLAAKAVCLVAIAPTKLLAVSPSEAPSMPLRSPIPGDPYKAMARTPILLFAEPEPRLPQMVAQQHERMIMLSSRQAGKTAASKAWQKAYQHLSVYGTVITDEQGNVIDSQDYAAITDYHRGRST